MFGDAFNAKTLFELLHSDNGYDRDKFYDSELPYSTPMGNDLYINPFRPNTGVGGDMSLYFVFDSGHQLTDDFAESLVRVLPSFNIAKMSLGFPYGQGGKVDLEYYINFSQLMAAETPRKNSAGLTENKYAITSAAPKEIQDFLLNPNMLTGLISELNKNHRIGYVNMGNY